MKIDLTTAEVSLLMELMQDWKTHRPEEINIIDGIVKKIYDSTKIRKDEGA